MPSSLKAADETVQNVQCKVGKTMQRQGEKKRKRKTKPKAKMKQRKETRGKQRVEWSGVEWSGVIKNNDHFAISWQITIHQIVQITDISQWREHFGTLSTSQPRSAPLFVSPPRLPIPFWWVGSAAAVRMASAIRLHQFYGNKLLLCLWLSCWPTSLMPSSCSLPLLGSCWRVSELSWLESRWVWA